MTRSANRLDTWKPIDTRTYPEKRVGREERATRVSRFDQSTAVDRGISPKRATPPASPSAPS